MDFPDSITLKLICIILLITLLILSKNSFKLWFSKTIYTVHMCMILFVTGLLSLELIAIILPATTNITLISANKYIRSIMVLLYPIFPLLEIVYVKAWLKLKFNLKLDIIPTIINFIFCSLNLKFNYLFNVNSNNTYSRGSLFFIPLLIIYFYFTYCLILIIKYKNNFSRKDFYLFLSFVIVPAITCLIQVITITLTNVWTSIAVVLLINYFILQEKILLYDPLTSARNRFALNIEIARLTSKRQKFGIIFIDLDHFKLINDTFGHSEGDEALINTVKIIKSTFTNSGYVCRFGGDEFIVIINESQLNSARDLLLTLELNFKKHNQESNKPYDINYSYGFDLFDDRYETINDCLSHIDYLMYKNKNNNHLIYEI